MSLKIKGVFLVTTEVQKSNRVCLQRCVIMGKLDVVLGTRYLGNSVVQCNVKCYLMSNGRTEVHQVVRQSQKQSIGYSWSYGQREKSCNLIEENYPQI